jgi:hypothetical protein
MSEAKGERGACEEWYLYLPARDEVVQPYRSAPTAWPISAEECNRAEAQAQLSNPSALNTLGILPYVLISRITSLRVLLAGMLHLFGWGKRPVNRYKAYDCFCRAHSAGCAAATNNRAVCKWLGYGCKEHEEDAKTWLAAASTDPSSRSLRLMATVGLISVFSKSPELPLTFHNVAP